MGLPQNLNSSTDTNKELSDNHDGHLDIPSEDFQHAQPAL